MTLPPFRGVSVMYPETFALLEFGLLCLLALGLAIFLTRPKKRPRKRPSKSKSTRRKPSARTQNDAAAILKSAQIDARPLFGSEERRVLSTLVAWERAQAGGYRVLRQVLLADIFRLSKTGSQSAWQTARESFNEKRVDFLIVDAEGWPILAVEYQDIGHYERGTSHRDDLKKLIFKRAGVVLKEIDKNTSLPRFLDEIDAMLAGSDQGVA